MVILVTHAGVYSSALGTWYTQGFRVRGVPYFWGFFSKGGGVSQTPPPSYIFSTIQKKFNLASPRKISGYAPTLGIP